jgi:hypothetical protein
MLAVAWWMAEVAVDGLAGHVEGFGDDLGDGVLALAVRSSYMASL